jgi:fructokinase
MPTLDVLCVGEALVDFLPTQRGRLRELDHFDVHSGGAPANVAVGLARQGLAVGFAGVVGEDEFGHLLARKLAAEGISAHLRFASEARTGLWFVALDDRGDRSFFNPIGRNGADKLIAASDVPDDLIAQARWVHCGSSAHVLPGGQEALRSVMARARAGGVSLSFDPNFRPALWPSPADFAAFVRPLLGLCDLVKLSDEELPALLGHRDPHRGAQEIIDLGARLACITCGPQGAVIQRGSERFPVPAPAVTVLDTTGAGDGFVAGVLSRIAKMGNVRSIPLDELRAATTFGCEIGAAVCTCLGAVAGLPRNRGA